MRRNAASGLFTGPSSLFQLHVPANSHDRLKAPQSDKPEAFNIFPFSFYLLLFTIGFVPVFFIRD